MERICVQWPRLGPYHVARIRALASVARSEGAEIVALETAQSDRVYAWDHVDEDHDFERVCVFPERTFETIRPKEMREAVMQTLDRIGPDAVLVNSYSFPDARACLSWCRSRRRVAVVGTDSKEDAAERLRWREAFKSLLVRQFDAALLAGTPQREYFAKLGFPERYIFLGYDVVDNDYFREAADAIRASGRPRPDLPGLEDESPFFLSVGRYIPQKNFERLIEAYAGYRRSEESPRRLVLVGDGPLRAAYETAIGRLGVEGVVLTGFMQQSELPEYYGRASAYVHPAVNDQWGLTVNEAMASGLPVVVSSRTGCAYDLVHPGRNGHRFNPESTASIQQALHLVTRPSEHMDDMGRASREIVDRWSLSYFADQAWTAFNAGLARSGRGMDPRVKLGLWALDRFSKGVDSFHTVEP